MRRLGAGVVSELDANYRDFALNGANQGGGALHAGDRVPDVAVTDSGPARMLDPSRLTIITLNPAMPPDLWQPGRLRALCVQPAVTAPSAALLAALGNAAVAVVRPGGYLLCAGSAAAVQAQLKRWGARWLTAEA